MSDYWRRIQYLQGDVENCGFSLNIVLKIFIIREGEWSFSNETLTFSLLKFEKPMTISITITKC